MLVTGLVTVCGNKQDGQNSAPKEKTSLTKYTTFVSIEIVKDSSNNVVDVDLSKLQEGEYLVIGTPRIEIPPIPVEEKDAIMTFSFRQVKVRTNVKNQDDPRYELCASAERVRNYLAYVLLLRLPMIFDMIGKRHIRGQWSPLPFPAVYEGSTHLPLTDGGNGDTSIFKTGFGPPDGEPPPLDARQSLDALTSWHTALNQSLARVQRLLDRIPVLTPQDDAVNLFGQAIGPRRREEDSQIPGE